MKQVLLLLICLVIGFFGSYELTNVTNDNALEPAAWRSYACVVLMGMAIFGLFNKTNFMRNLT